MRNLLIKWAESEPDKCKSKNWWFKIFLNNWHFTVYEKEPGEMDLSWLQWAIQQAIVSRGWEFETSYTPASGYGAEVINPSRCRVRKYSDNNSAEALLTAYLQALNHG